MGPVSKLLPDQFRFAYRAAALAYREKRRLGFMDLEAHRAASAAVQEILPAVPSNEAGRTAGAAVAYASAQHSGWFWQGVGSNGE